VEEGGPQYLTWEELDRLQHSGRWEVQLPGSTNPLGRFEITRATDEPELHRLLASDP